MLTFITLLAACNGGGGPGNGGGSDLVTELVAEPGAVPGTVWVRWSSPEQGTGTVQFGQEAPDEQSSAPSAVGTEHAVLLLEPQVGREYKIVVDYETTDGETGTSEEVEVTVVPPGQGSIQFQQSVWQPEKSCMDGGYVMFSWLGQNASGIGILDREGKYVWGLKNEVEETLISRARLGRDGSSIWFADADADRCEDLATVRTISMDGETVTTTSTEQGHHDFIELPDGRIAWLGFEFNDVDLVDDDPDAGVVSVATDTIVVDGQTLFSFYDTFGPDIYDVSQRVNTDTEFLRCIADYEYSHANSLVYHQADGAFLMSFRWLDTMVKVDAASGDLLWTWGNLPGTPGDFTPAAPTVEEDRFVHSHFSEAWDDKVLIFDNHDPGPSILKEFSLDEGAGTFSLDWSFETERLETILGDVRRMPVEGCDNVLISYSQQARIVEMTREGEIVWEVAGVQGGVTSRVQFIPDLYDFSAVAYP